MHAPQQRVATHNEEPDKNLANLQQIVHWVAEGRLDPMVQKTFPLDQGKEALQWVAERKSIGRVVINP